MITQELLKNLFDYKDGFLYWRVKKCNSTAVGGKAGSLNKQKYHSRHSIKINAKSYYTSRLVFLWHNGWLPDVLDHINRDPTDDRIENLRIATRSENSKNKTSHKGSTSKYLGVYLSNNGKKWVASIWVNKKGNYLGSFINENEAALAYNEAAKTKHGEFANLNIII